MRQRSISRVRREGSLSEQVLTLLTPVPAAGERKGVPSVLREGRMKGNQESQLGSKKAVSERLYS